MITEIVQFTKKVYENGEKLEYRVRKYLDSMNIRYRYSTNRGIDFIIEGQIYLDAVAQGISGTIGDKLPTKCFKYIQKYKLQGGDIYILHPYAPIHRIVGEHLELIENTFNCKIHVLDWNDFTYLMNGGNFKTRKPYNYSKSSYHVSNNAPTNMNIKKFFEIKC